MSCLCGTTPMHPDATVPAMLTAALACNMLESASSSLGSHNLQLEWGLYHEIKDSFSVLFSESYKHLDGKRDANARLSISLSDSPACFDTVEPWHNLSLCVNQYSISAHTPDFLAIKRTIDAYYLRLKVHSFCVTPSRSRASKATWSVFFRIMRFVTKNTTRVQYACRYFSTIAPQKISKNVVILV